MKNRTWWIMVSVFALVVPVLVLGSRASRAQSDDAAAKLFKNRCATCHGPDGKGDTTAGKAAGTKDWTDGKTLKALSDQQIEGTIRTGVKAPSGKDRMPPFAKLPDAEVAALRKIVRSFQH